MSDEQASPQAFEDLERFFAQFEAKTLASGPPPSHEEVGEASAAPALSGSAPAVGEPLADVLRGLDDGGAVEDEVGSAPDADAAFAAADRVVLFSVGDTRYGARIPQIVEVGHAPAITAIPNLPSWVRGVMNLRGDIVSVIDLKSFSGLGQTLPHEGRLLVAREEDEDLTVGILVERVHEITLIPASSVRQPAMALEGPLAPFLLGLCERESGTAVMLDVAALLRSPEIRQFEDLHETSVEQ